MIKHRFLSTASAWEQKALQEKHEQIQNGRFQFAAHPCLSSEGECGWEMTPEILERPGGILAGGVSGKCTGQGPSQHRKQGMVETAGKIQGLSK